MAMPPRSLMQKLNQVPGAFWVQIAVLPFMFLKDIGVHYYTVTRDKREKREAEIAKARLRPTKARRKANAKTPTKSPTIKAS